MINKHKLYSIALCSIAIALMLVSIAGASPFAYITNYESNNVSVVDTATSTVTATVAVGYEPYGVAVAPDGKKVYVVSSNIDKHCNRHCNCRKLPVSLRQIHK